MTDKMLAKAREILDNYLETNQHRRTQERYAILDVAYHIGGHFTLDELSDLLEKNHFRVSKATLYNAMHLFMGLGLVMRHNLVDGTKYEACLDDENHVHQVCTVCGKVTEMYAPKVANAVGNMKLQDFRMDAFALYVYGVCGACQEKLMAERSAGSCVYAQAKREKYKNIIK